MRVTAELFVAQLTRRVFADGGFAAILRRGADAAGAIFIVARQPDGRVTLYAPAAQALAADDGERRFMAEPPVDDEALQRRLAREERFDPDFWVVELETSRPQDYVALVAPDRD